MAVFTKEDKGTRGDGSKFEKVVNENRKATAAYYTQRINNVLKAYTIEENNKNNEEYIQKFREALFDFFANQISVQFNTKLQTAMAMPNLTQIVQTTITNSEGKEEIKRVTAFRTDLSNRQLKKLGNLFNVDPVIIQNLIKNSWGTNEKGETTVASAATVFGHIQEEFIQNTAETFLHQFTNYEQNLIKDIENMIIGAVSVGSKPYPYESSPFRSKGHLVGVDFGKNVLDKNNQPKEHLELGAEFKIDLNYSNYKHNPKNFSDLRKYAAIEYAYSNKSMEYGIQIKNVTSKESGFKYRSYAPLKERINEQYKKGEDLSFDNWERTWNANYGLWFMMAKVSDNFIGILGPETIGVLFRDGYMWMDDFVKSYTLRYGYSAKYTKYNNDFEIRPILNQNNINAYKTLNPRVLNLYEKQDENKNDLSIGMSWTKAQS